MAPKRSNNPIEDPPLASSSEEEEDEEATSSEEEEEDDDEGPKTQTPKKPETAALATAVDESDESGSDSETESGTPSPTVKPIATKPMEETSNVRRPRSKPPLASPVKASSAKRPSVSDQEDKESKRLKKKAGEEGTDSAAAAVVVEELKNTGDDPKKQLFQRLFSEDDEIAMLKGMLDYSAKNGADPCADMNAFYDFVKKSIHTDVTKAQLMDKIRRLRKKFENNAGKGKKGEDRAFSKPHEQKAFELSKMIWGKEGISGKLESSSARSTGKAKGTSKASASMKDELPASLEKIMEHEQPLEGDKKSLGCWFDKRFGVAGLEEEIVKKGLDIVGKENRAFLEEKWRKLQVAELELFVQRSELIKEHAELMLEFYKSEAK